MTMILQGLHLGDYQQVFIKKGISFDTFVNLTREDLIVLGITDEEDIATLLEGLKPFQNLFKEVDIFEPPKYVSSFFCHISS
jgi:hypothetical protein